MCIKRDRKRSRKTPFLMGAVALRIAVLRTGWAHTSQKFAWATWVLRQFRTFLAKQGRSSLLFMLKSNKNPGPLLNGSRTPTGGPRGTRFPLDIPSPPAPSGSIKCLPAWLALYSKGCFRTECSNMGKKRVSLL